MAIPAAPAPASLALGFDAPPGFGRRTDGPQRVATLPSGGGTLQLGLPASNAGSCFLAAVLRVTGTTAATIVPSVDGDALTPWSLGTEWEAFSSPTVSCASKKGAATVRLTPTSLEKGASILAQSVALRSMTDRVSIVAGTLESVGVFVSGFESARGRGEEPLWSVGPESRIALQVAPRPTTYRLTFDMHAFGAVAPLEVMVRANGHRLGSATVSSKRAQTSWEVPPGTLRANINEFVLSYARTASPAETSASGDARQLAVRIFHVALVPVQSKG